MHNTYKLWRLIKFIVLEIFSFFKKILFSVLSRIWEKFVKFSIPGKIILLNIIPAFFAIILPVAKFNIFEGYYSVNNPLGVYLIGVIIIMIASYYLKGITKLLTRSFINAYYLFWIVYIPFAGGLTKAQPYDITYGYYLNIAVPAIFIAASLADYFMYRE
ncbi:MAG: hypothetical protein JXN64_03060 [Spirochaetes bacterium]|nr:hypothetical protein [Spirochaetota bacterium]